MLVELASILRTHLRREDLPTRLGGDELAVLMADTTAEEAAETLERVRRAVASHPFLKNGGDQSHVTISTGVAGSRIGEPITELLCRADIELYAAKHAGRNQVSVTPSLESHVALAKTKPGVGFAAA